MSKRFLAGTVLVCLLTGVAVAKGKKQKKTAVKNPAVFNIESDTVSKKVVVNAQDTTKPKPAARIEKEPEGVQQALCKVGTSLPEYRIIRSDRSDFYTKDLPEDKNFILVLFNPTCDHCQRQAIALMEAQKTSLKNTIICYVTSQMQIDLLPEFEKKVSYTTRDNFIVGVDTYDFSMNLFEYKYLPQLIIYNKAKKVVKVFHRETEIEKILPFIEN